MTYQGPPPEGEPQWQPPVPAYPPPPAQPAPYYPPQYQQQPMYMQPSGHRAGSDKRTSTVELVFAWIFAVITVLYMLPWAVAATRGKSNSLAIALINFLLGWTLIGWIIALVMACGSHQAVGVSQVIINQGAYPPQYPPHQP